MATTRSMRKGSVIGMAPEATTTNKSMLATAGRWNSFFRGSTTSTVPEPSARAVTSTRSPTRGFTFSWRNFPLARQVTVPPPQST